MKKFLAIVLFIFTIPAIIDLYVMAMAVAFERDIVVRQYVICYVLMGLIATLIAVLFEVGSYLLK